ncbi:MAG: hypothetical protein KA200_00835 [Burkholderiales bacterium]|nr:hypothetical protein [Burkholderiales bacterium]
MSTPTKPTRPDLPSAAVDRVFERLNAIFGVQRMAAAWGGVPPDERRAVWGGAIGRAVWAPALNRFNLDSIRAALDELAEQPTSWPPSSGEFADRCARFAQRPGRSLLALPVPKRTDEDLARGRVHMDRIKAMLNRRAPAAEAREPGCDDEPLPPITTPACTCWTGCVRAETLCPTCLSKPIASTVRSAA